MNAKINQIHRSELNIYGGKQEDCIDEVNNDVMMRFKSPVDKKLYKRMALAGRVVDSQRMI